MIIIENESLEINRFHQRLEKTKNNTHLPSSFGKKEEHSTFKIEKDPDLVRVRENELKNKLKARGFSEEELQRVSLGSSIRTATKALFNFRREELLRKGYSREELGLVKIESFPLLSQIERRLDRLRKKNELLNREIGRS